MYERFTDRARRVMQLANQESQRFNHEYIGTEHLLLGLIKESNGVAANVLKQMGIDLRRARLEVEKLVHSGPEMITMGKLPKTPRTHKVIEYSMQEARNLAHQFVGTEHLLLGLLHVEEGVAAEVLGNLGLELDHVRTEVLSLLGAGLDPIDANEKPASQKRLARKPAIAGPHVFDLVAYQKHFAREIEIDSEALNEIWTALNLANGHHVFLIGESTEVQEYVLAIADSLISGDVPNRFSSSQNLFSVDQAKLGSKIEKVFEQVGREGQAVFSFERIRDLDCLRSRDSIDWALLFRLRGWLNRTALNVLLSGDEHQFEEMRKAWPELANEFVVVRLPGWSKMAIEQLMEDEIQQLQIHHLVLISSEAIEAAQDGATQIQDSANPTSNELFQSAVRLLDLAASEIALQSERENRYPRATQGRLELTAMAQQKEQLLANQKFATAQSIALKMEQLFDRYCDIQDSLPAVEVSDVQKQIRKLKNSSK